MSDRLAELVRDLTKVHPMSKSEVRRRIKEYTEAEVDKARREEHQDMMKRSWANDTLRITFHEACIASLSKSNNTGG